MKPSVRNESNDMLSCAAIEVMYFTGADFNSTPRMAPMLGFRNKTTVFIETY